MMSYSQLQRLSLKALAAGAVQTAVNILEWDVMAYCDKPVTRTLHARQDDGEMRKHKWTENQRGQLKTLTVHVLGISCRKCAKCLWIRGERWKERACAELARWPRTWLFTGTLNGETHHDSYMRMLDEKNRKGYPDSDFSGDKEFLCRSAGLGRITTNWLKRVRKPLDGEPKISLRYMLVTERHESGLPHMHALVHEVAGPLTKRRLQSRWETHGFSTCKLVWEGSRSAHYVTKYLTKSSLTRVRASQGYGGQSRPSDIEAMVASLEPLEKGSLSISSPAFEQSFNW